MSHCLITWGWRCIVIINVLMHTFLHYCLFAEYLIPIGTPEPDGSCKFTYRSLSRKEGRFNSPRHPSNYPSSTNCTYYFFAMPDEQACSHIKLQNNEYEWVTCIFLGQNCFWFLQSEDWQSSTKQLSGGLESLRVN